MKVRIEITKGPDNGRQILLEPQQKVVVGRGEDADVRMLDALVSREHCEIVFDGQRLLVRDLGSTNRTFFVHQNQPDPLEANRFYELKDGAFFFVGTESRFVVTFVENRPNEDRPAGRSTAYSRPIQDVEKPAAPSTGNFSESLVPGRGPRSADLGDSSVINLIGPPINSPGIVEDRPVAPTPPPSSRPANPQPPAISSNFAGSIAPPHLQGQGDRIREQVSDDEPVDQAWIKSTPIVEKPHSNDNFSTEPADVRQAPPDPIVEPERQANSPFADSIAQPGQIYPAYKPNPTTVADEPAIPESSFSDDAGKVEKEASESPLYHQNKNGLHFHHGDNVTELPLLVSQLTADLAVVYCVDFTRFELPDSGTSESQSLGDSGVDSTASDSEVKYESSFDLDDDESESGGAPKANEGVPLFDFLPEGLKENGPMLQQEDQFKIPFDVIWESDALVAFFGPDSNAMVADLKALLHTNIQNGKPSKGMFGFCWPSVIHTTLESQGAEQVSRVFGDSITCVLLEDPLQRHAWSLISHSNMADKTSVLQR